MEKIFTRYVVTLVFALWASLPISAEEVVINEDFSSSVYSSVIFGQVNSLSNGWTVCRCSYNYGAYREALFYGKSAANYGYVTTKSFGEQVESHNARLYFDYAISSNGMNSRVCLTIQGGGTFDGVSQSSKNVDLKYEDKDFHTKYCDIFGATRNTTVTMTLASDNYFWLDNVKVVAAGEFSISETGTATTFEAQLADVTLGRTLSAGVWSTLCLPFDVTTEAMQTATRATEVKMCTFDSYEDGTMTFKKTDEVTAGKPFLVKVNTTVENPTFLLVDVKNTEAKTEEHGDVSMVGCYGQTDLNADGERMAVFLTADGSLKRPSAASWTMKGLRAYFLVPSSFPGARVMIDDEEVTAIDAVLKPESTGGGELYSLTGQRQTQSVRPGIYINNGKKVIIK